MFGTFLRFEVRGNLDPSLMVGEVELLDLDVR